VQEQTITTAVTQATGSQLQEEEEGGGGVGSCGTAENNPPPPPHGVAAAARGWWNRQSIWVRTTTTMTTTAMLLCLLVARGTTAFAAVVVSHPNNVWWYAPPRMGEEEMVLLQGSRGGGGGGSIQKDDHVSAETYQRRRIREALLELDATLKGDVYFSDNDAFAGAARVWRVGGGSGKSGGINPPAAVIVVATERDVQLSLPVLVNLQRRHNFTFRVRSAHQLRR
jgi:hypothetical protein